LTQSEYEYGISDNKSGALNAIKEVFVNNRRLLERDGMGFAFLCPSVPNPVRRLVGLCQVGPVVGSLMIA
jgi:hypothetical protein